MSCHFTVLYERVVVALMALSPIDSAGILSSSSCDACCYCCCFLSGKQNVTVKRCYVGTFVTSMEMAGVSLTLMVLNEDRVRYLGEFC